MLNLPYSESEIRVMYRQAKDKHLQLRILADLNCCSVKEIENVLNYEEEKDMKPRLDWESINKKLDEGVSVSQICEESGINKSNVYRHRQGKRKLSAVCTGQPEKTTEGAATGETNVKLIGGDDTLDVLERCIAYSERLARLPADLRSRVETVIERVLAVSGV